MDRHAHIRPLTIFGVATALTFFSAFQAFYFVSTFTEKPAPFSLLFFLNLGYWYSWACIAPAILWISRRFPLDKQHWHVSLPVHVVGVFAATTLHIAMAVSSRMLTGWALGESEWSLGESGGSWRLEAQRMFFLNFDWEMMTYWAIVGLSHALGYRREAQARALNASQLETRLVEAQLQSLQRQLQPHFLFNTLEHDLGADAPGRRGRRHDDRAAERSAAHLAADGRRAGESRSRKSWISCPSTWRSNKRASATVSPWCSMCNRTPWTRWCQTLFFSRSSKTRSSMASGRGPRRARSPSGARLAGSERLELIVQDNGVGMSAARLSDFNRGVGLSNTRARLEHSLRSRSTALNSGSPPKAACRC